jgi:hypothetical protein
MGEPKSYGSAEGSGPPARASALFLGLLGVYYVVYYVLFAGRVAEYFGDVLKHFAFVRRWF